MPIIAILMLGFVGLLGAGLVTISLYSLWASWFGGPKMDPFRWPIKSAVVSGHRPVWESRTGRIPVGRGPHIEQVYVWALVKVPTLDGEVIKEVRPKILNPVRVTQPADMSFSEFMSRAGDLAVDSAREILPVGTLIDIAVDPAKLDTPGYVGARAIDNTPNKFFYSLVLLIILFIGLILLGIAMLAFLAPSSVQ